MKRLLVLERNGEDPWLYERFLVSELYEWEKVWAEASELLLFG